MEVRSRKVGVSVILAGALLGPGARRSYPQVNVWISRGPEGGYVSRPVIDVQKPGTIYVSAGPVAFKTVDAAAHWGPIESAPGAVVAVDAQDSNTVYSGDPSGGLSRSKDGGLTWGPPGAALACGYSQLAIDPKNSGTLYVPCLYSVRSGSDGVYGIFKSRDGGASWSAASAGIPLFATYGGIDNLLVDPANPQVLYASSTAPLDWGAALYKSTDGGMNWLAAASASQFPPGRGRIRLLAIDPKQPATLYAAGGTASDGVITGILFQSTDGGSNWTVINSSFTSLIGGLVIDPQDSGILYAQTDHAIFKSADRGATWSVIVPYGGWLAAAPSGGGPSVLYTARDSSGILKSTDGGVTWTTANSGLTATSIRALAIDPQHPGLLAAAIDGFGIGTSEDGAESWTETPVAQSITNWRSIRSTLAQST
jgi:photosystem II stability/assembly factor-like uncharacterized protein